MLFELLMGRRPYRETEPMSLIFAKLDPGRDPLLSCQELDPFGPIAAVLRRAMAWAAADRYASADEFRAALAAAAAEMGPDERVVLAFESVDLNGQLDSVLSTIQTPAIPAGPRTRPSTQQPLVTPDPNTGGFAAEFPTVAQPAAKAGSRIWLAVAAGVAVAGGVALWLVLTTTHVGIGIRVEPRAEVADARSMSLPTATPSPAVASGPAPAPPPVAGPGVPPAPVPVAQPLGATAQSAQDRPAEPEPPPSGRVGAGLRARPPSAPAPKVKKAKPSKAFQTF